jgi:hypothetical protein
MEAIGINEVSRIQEEGPSRIQEKEYRPTDEQALRRYEITLRFLDRGMVVRVGCKEIAFSNSQEGIDALNKYIADPYNEQVRWEQSFN